MEPTMTPPRSGGPETGPKTGRSASLRVKLLAVLERAASTPAGRAVGWLCISWVTGVNIPACARSGGPVKLLPIFAACWAVWAASSAGT